MVIRRKKNLYKRKTFLRVSGTLRKDRKGKERRRKSGRYKRYRDELELLLTIHCKITELQAYYTFILLNLLTKVGVST